MKKFSLFRKIISLLIVASLLFSMMLLTGCQWIEKFTKKKNEEQKDPDGGYVNEKAADGRADFIEEIGGVSDTYRGAVSKKSYSSDQVAAVAFVTEEIVGDKEIHIESVNSKGKLSAEETNALNFPTEISSGMSGIYKFEVTYSTPADESTSDDTVVSSCSAEATSNTVVTVYVIKYENEWKYYSPIPVPGKTITKSYYDSVFNEERFNNCTLNSEMTITMSVEATEGTKTKAVDIEVTMKQLVKYDGNKIYAEIYTKTYMSQDGSADTHEETTYLFIEDRETYIACYVKKFKMGEWTPTSINKVGFTSIEELAPFYDQYFDYTYFTKTSFGFAIEEKNAKQYFNEAMEEVADMLPYMFNEDDMTIDMFAEYYVSGGVLSGVRSDASVEFSLTENGVTAEADESVVVSTTVTNYGTTVVESPVD